MILYLFVYRGPWPRGGVDDFEQVVTSLDAADTIARARYRYDRTLNYAHVAEVTAIGFTVLRRYANGERSDRVPLEGLL